MTPVCPTCGCSLVRLGIELTDAPRHEHRGNELLFCCHGCVDLFRERPHAYMDESRDWIVCPTCLAERPKQLTISIAYEGEEVRFCRCPHCVDEFRRRPTELLARLAG